MKRLLKIKEVGELTGLSKMQIYRMEARGEFPPRREVSPGRVAWLSSEVEEWVESRPVRVSAQIDKRRKIVPRELRIVERNSSVPAPPDIE